MKKKDTILKEFVKSISDDELAWMFARLKDRIGPDLAEVVEAFQNYPEINVLLLEADSANTFYDLIDEITAYVERDFNRRGLSLLVEVEN